MKYILHVSIITILTLLATINNSCTSDFELNAPYDEIPIIFGVLDQSVDTQFVKINKSFIGGGDNAAYAAINDSSLYTNVVGTVEEYIDNSLTRTFNLQEKWINNLDAGIFYTDSQKVFYFVPVPKLDQNATYKIVINTAEETAPITAETDLVKGSGFTFDFLFTNAASLFGLQFANASTLSGGGYLAESPSWQTVPDGKKYELTMRLHYLEVTATSSQYKYIDWDLGTQESATLNGGKKMTNRISGESFYETINNKLAGYAYEADVIKRVINSNNVEFIITIANDNLNTYMQVNEPSTGVITERPVFSNIEGGAGIFASRFSKKVITYLDSHSTNVLCTGPQTGGYKFCIDPSYDVSISGHDILTTYPNIVCP